MDKPEIADRKPCVLEVEAGTYRWCACGKSKGQPFCDGSHKGSGLAPLVVVVPEKKKAAFCACKQTKTPPFCDGSHKQL